ncbi:hypothetical protein BVY00_01730 [bacterium G20]|nr:hypothetical protein BVY00_01730 [bacterium G20]
MGSIDYQRNWESRYTYPVDESGVQEESLHIVKFEYAGGSRTYVTSLPGQESTLWMDLMLQENILSGIWQEETSPSGRYRGELFHGVIHLIMNSACTRAEGKWLGHNQRRTKVNVGEWVLEREKTAPS